MSASTILHGRPWAYWLRHALPLHGDSRRLRWLPDGDAGAAGLEPVLAYADQRVAVQRGFGRGSVS